MGNVKKSVAERTRHQRQYDRRVNKRQMQTQESKIDTGKVVDNGLVVMESNGTESEVQDDSSRSGQWLRSKTIQQTTSLLANNADLKAQIQEKVFAIAALKNELRKLKGNSVDTKFAKTSVLGKIVLQPLRNQSVVRQSNAFKSERPQMSKQRFQSTANGSKPKPRNNNQTPRSLHVSKSSCITIKVVPKADHSKSSSSFSDSKQFVCSTYHKCVFNANHDACITKLLKEVNSRAKIQFQKTRNSNKPIDQKSHTQTPGRHIFTRHRFSSNKTFDVYEKTSPGSDLKWKPTGRIFKYVGLSVFPKRKSYLTLATSRLTLTPTWFKLDIPNIHEANKLGLSAGTSIIVQEDKVLILSTENQIVSKSSIVTTANASDKRQQQPDSTSSTSTLATTVTADGNFDL
ncbi:hypothetical protein Tco_0551359 [Tanacetum coccineum]